MRATPDGADGMVWFQLGHWPDAVVDGIPRVRCAECRPTATPGEQEYPCQTAQNAIWVLEGVFS